MAVKLALSLAVLVMFLGAFESVSGIHNPNGSTLTGIELPDHLSFNAVSSSASTGCSFSKQSESTMEAVQDEEDRVVDVSMEPHKSVKFNLKHNPLSKETEPKKSVAEFTIKDLTRIQTLHTRIVEKKNQNTISRLNKEREQAKNKKQYKSVLAQSVDAPATSPESYASGPFRAAHGDLGIRDFALETFTVNLTTASGKSEFRRVENVMFGCGHWNRGLFHGAAGLLGLGRGSLSFSSQLQSLYGHSFSYCLVDRNSDTNVSSKLIFGESKELLSHPNLNFTSFVVGKQNLVDTFYYVQIKSIMVGGEVLNITRGDMAFITRRCYPGGTIIDSGTTLSYFAEPAYQIIKEAFLKKVKGYPVVEDFPILNPCYNVSGVEKMELPEFGIQFADGAVWNFPVENYFIRLEPEDIVCLAILGTPRSSLSIIGNYQQQNFHIWYDIKKSRLGYAPMSCADV
uniref:Peptidase A1 domain-containing protein n=1 Tax=Fagus sylvatica TaxID=28930 RepID=A0A2N9EY76_FAGSY